MARRRSRLSLFGQKLDRATFAAYFLGAVVPLVALGWVVQRFALPALDRDASGGALQETGPMAMLGLLVSVGVLSLAAFLVLRRLTRQTLRQMHADNERLQALLQVSTDLGAASHAGDVAGVVARCARRVTGAEAAFLFLSHAKGAPPELIHHEGGRAEALYTAAQKHLDAMVKLAMEGGRPALVSDDGGRTRDAALRAAAAVPIAGGRECSGAILVATARGEEGFTPAQVGSLATLAANAGVALHNADLREAQQNFFAHVTDILVSALDSHLDLQSGHSRRVAHLANAMGRELAFDDGRLQRLHFAALLHDLGMLKIERSLQGSRAHYQRHPGLGFRMLDRIRLWEDLAPFVNAHHEWWNGCGYPEGVAGDAIPLEARIIGIAEAFDSMLTARYKQTVEVDEALSRLEEAAGVQFDPELVRIFAELVRRGGVRIEAGEAS